MQRTFTVAIAFAVVCGCGAVPLPASPVAPGFEEANAPWYAAFEAAGQDPTGLRCSGRQVWDPGMRKAAATMAQEAIAEIEASGVVIPEEGRHALVKRMEEVALWRLIRRLMLGGRHHNASSVRLDGLTTTTGAPVILFRSGFTSTPTAANSCFRSLVEAGGVRHVINLYAGAMPSGDLEAEEELLISEAGGTYFNARDAGTDLATWRERLRDEDDPAGNRAVMKIVARLINQYILRHGGERPRGNVHVHCGGGMHRTGMIVGILERCMNEASDDAIERDYRRHVAWRSEESPGGYEAGNMAFILGFDCGLIDAPQP